MPRAPKKPAKQPAKKTAKRKAATPPVADPEAEEADPVVAPEPDPIDPPEDAPLPVEENEDEDEDEEETANLERCRRSFIDDLGDDDDLRAAIEGAELAECDEGVRASFAEPVRRHAVHELEARALSDENEIELSFSSETPVDMGYGTKEILSHEKSDANFKALRQVGSVLKNHNPNQIVGVPIKVWLDEKTRKGMMRMRFGSTSGALRARQEVLIDKTLRGVSVGYEIHEIIFLRDKDTKYKGRIAGPSSVVSKWSGYEASFTPIPADTSVGVGRAKRQQQQEIEIMDPKFKVWLESRNLKAEDVLADASQLAEHLATYEREIAEAEKPPAVPAPEAVPGDDAATVAQAALTAERTRVKSIREIGKAQGIESDAIDVFIDDGNSLEETRAKVLDVLADRSQALGGNIEVTADGREKRAKAMSSAMQFRTGMIGRDKIEEGGEEFCGLTLKEFARDCLERSGNSTRSLSDHAFSEMALRGPKLNSDSIRAFAQRGEVIAGSTSDFPYILAATANKSLLDAYNTAKSTWEQWCSSGSLSDFKEAGRIKLSDMGDLEVVPEGGHYPEGKASDSREPIQLKTYGKRFSITRQAIINDDLSAFTRIPASMGSAARRVPDQLAIALLLSNPTMSDGHALFSAGHNNLSQVAGNRPDTLAHALAGLQALSLLLSKQTAFLATLEEDDSDTLYLDLEPSVWFGGPTYTWNRKTVATSAGSVEDDKNAGVSNAAADMGLTVLQTAKLEDTNITGNSAYSHYLFARPSDAAVIEVAFLQGNREPYMEETDQTDVDGRIMKVRMDCVAGVVDYVGAVKETGV